MSVCKDCLHFNVCSPYTDPNETYPELGGCPAFKNKDDYEKVTRCKECKHYELGNNGCSLCREQVGLSMWCDDNHYCSYGERREQ